MKIILPIAAFFTICIACTKQSQIAESSNQSTESVKAQGFYLSTVRKCMKDSLTKDDFSALDFDGGYKSKDAETPYYFFRVRFFDKDISTDFLLLKTDSIGNLIKGRIVHVKKNLSNKNLNDNRFLFTVASLNRKQKNYITNKHSNITSKESPVGEQTLPEVVVTCYTNNDNGIYWYWYGGIVDADSQSGGGTYTYGSSSYGGGTGGGGTTDNTIDIEVEGDDLPPVSVKGYIKCFSKVSNNGAVYKIAINTDIPVNGDPSRFFDYNTGSVGHTFLTLTKSANGTTVQQSLGFYPQSGFKSVAGYTPVSAKVVDNGNHEYNASLSIFVDATHFQNALNKIESYINSKYDIDDFNCTDYGLSAFNTAAPTLLEIPQNHIPGGAFGNVSNTPQGLFSKLFSLYEAGGPGGYSGGSISIPFAPGHVGSSHGSCN